MSGTGDAEGDLVAVSGTGSAEGGVLAVSALGSAHARCDRYGTWVCAVAAGGGHATGSPWHAELANGRACTVSLCADANGTSDTVITINRNNARGLLGAISIEGDARSSYLAASGWGDAYVWAGVAASAFGNARGWYAGVAPFGDAYGGVALTLDGEAEGGSVAVSPCGEAMTQTGGGVALDRHDLGDHAAACDALP